MLRHVSANAGAERGLADIALQHSDQGLSLGVGDAVEGGHRLAFVGDGLLDWVRRAPCVEFHGAIFRAARIEPRSPLRKEMLRRLRLHPAGEAFVEPEIIPPGHGDEITEPLVRHLVSENTKDAAASGLATHCGIEQETALKT